jgi:hypothetical protein
MKTKANYLLKIPPQQLSARTDADRWNLSQDVRPVSEI